MHQSGWCNRVGCPIKKYYFIIINHLAYKWIPTLASSQTCLVFTENLGFVNTIWYLELLWRTVFICKMSDRDFISSICKALGCRSVNFDVSKHWQILTPFLWQNSEKNDIYCTM